MLDTGSILDIQTAEVFEPLLMPCRWKGAQGGRASGKSHFFADNLIDLSMSIHGLRWLLVREHQTSLKQSVKLLLEDKVRQYGLGAYFDPRLGHVTTPGGGVWSFTGMKNHTSDSVKSYEAYDGAWVEEAQRLSKRSFEMLYPTIRKERRIPQLPVSELWFSWNPDRPTDPVDSFFRGPGAVHHKLSDVTLVTANWMHNPWLSQVSRNDLEFDRRTDPEKFAWIWGGGYNTRSNSRVFKNWRIGDISEFPEWKEFDRLYLGADFGFATDPSVLIVVGIKGRKLYILAEAYMVGCEIDHTPFLFGGVQDFSLRKLNEAAYDSISIDRRHLYPGIEDARRWPIIADTARPETISYMKRHGFPLMESAKKGPGSLEEGVKFLQGYEIIVHPDCVHSVDELTMYAYKVDPLTDEVLPILSDKKNHVIDAIRYSIEKLRRAKGGLF